MSSSVQAQPQVHIPSESHTEASLLSRPEGCTYQVTYEVTTQTLYVEGHQERLEWLVVDDNSTLMLQWSQRSAPPLPALLAAIEGAFAFHPGAVALRLQLPTVLHPTLCANGIAVKDSHGKLWPMRSYFGSCPRFGSPPLPSPPTRSSQSWRMENAIHAARRAPVARCISAILPG